MGIAHAIAVTLGVVLKRLSLCKTTKKSRLRSIAEATLSFRLLEIVNSLRSWSFRCAIRPEAIINRRSMCGGTTV